MENSKNRKNDLLLVVGGAICLTVAVIFIIGDRGLSSVEEIEPMALSVEGVSANRAAYVGAESAATPAIHFQSDYRLALKEANDENKPILLFFMEPNCPFSREMIEKTFSDNAVRSLSESFICVRIDISQPESESICRQFDVAGSPTVQFLSARGITLQQIVRSQPPAEMKRQMEAVLNSVAWRMERSRLR